MQFWAAVDGFGLEDGGALGVGIFELVDVSVGGMVKTPSAAEVDNPDTPVDGFGNPLTGLLVRSSEKQDLCSGVDEAFPGEGKDLVSPVACDGELGVDVFEVERGGCLGFSGAAQKCGRCFPEPGVMQEKAREFAARVAADACDGSAGCGGA